MELSEIQKRALEIRRQYEQLETQKTGRIWTNEEITLGFVGDLGDLAKLVQAKEGIREIADVDEKLAHELADCLWCVLVLANKYDIDLEQSFTKTMDGLKIRIEDEMRSSR